MQEIRKVEKQDFYQFKVSLLHESLTGNEPGLLAALSDWTEESERGRQQQYGYFCGDFVAGVISCSEENDLETVAEVYTLIGIIFVHHRFRHQGIGGRLVEFVKKHARTDWIVASPADDLASAFFISCGFFPLNSFQPENETLLFFHRGSQKNPPLR